LASELHDTRKDRYKIDRCVTGRCGTTWYRSPEVLLNVQYDTAPELWSLGCVMYELFKYQTKDPAGSMETFEQDRYLFKEKGKTELQFEADFEADGKKKVKKVDTGNRDLLF
jgi:serine/threonine protein kinase